MFVPPDNYGMVEETIHRCSSVIPLNFAFLSTLNLKCILVLNAEKPSKALRTFVAEQRIDLIHLGLRPLGYYAPARLIEEKPIEISERAGTPTTDVSAARSLASSVPTSVAMRAAPQPHSLGTLGAQGASGGSATAGVAHLRPTTGNPWKLSVFPPEVLQEALWYALHKAYHPMLFVDSTGAFVGVLRRLEKWCFSSIIAEYRVFAGNRANYWTECFLEVVNVELFEPLEAVAMREAEKMELEREAEKMEQEAEKMPDEEDEDEKSDADDDSLCGSPQIPKTLMKLMSERRKHYKDHKLHPSEPITASQLTSSVNPARMRQPFYYPVHQFDVRPENNSEVLRVVLPEAEHLPEWFCVNREVWNEEAEYRATLGSVE